MWLWTISIEEVGDENEFYKLLHLLKKCCILVVNISDYSFRVLENYVEEP